MDQKPEERERFFSAYRWAAIAVLISVIVAVFSLWKGVLMEQSAHFPHNSDQAGQEMTEFVEHPAR